MSNVVEVDITQAKLWCEQARKILKLKRLGPSERKSFKDALNRVELLLPKLKEAKVYQEITRQYMAIATEAHNAELRKNTKDVVAASNKLAELAKTCEQLLKDHLKWKEKSEEVRKRLESKLLEVQKGYQLRDAYVIGSVVNQPLVQAQTLCDQASAI